MRYTEDQIKAIDHKFDVIAESATLNDGKLSNIIIPSMVSVLAMEIVGWPTKDNDNFDGELANQLIEIANERFEILIFKQSLLKHTN